MKKHTILIVDDIPENIDILAGLLKGAYELKAARDGEKALQIAESPHPPDLILLDIMMPGLNGYEVCRRLKARKKTRDIPVIFLTALSEIDSMVSGFEAGGVDYVIKPFNAVELTTRLNTHLALRAAAEQLKNQNIILEQSVGRRTALIRRKNEMLNAALGEKEVLLREVRSMEAQLRDSLNMLNRLYKKIVVIQEEERKRIAVDIHDRLGQLLTAAKLSLFRIQGKADPADEIMAGRIGAAIALLDDAVKATQDLSLQLRPDILDNLGFTEAVGWYCRKMREASDVEFTCETLGLPVSLGKETELALYRVIQEAATNVIRHARAKKCRIAIEGKAEFVRIRIEDDGKGINGDEVRDAESLGIYGMKKRIEEIRGDFGIEGKPGQGTVVNMLIPAGGASHD